MTKRQKLESLLGRKVVLVRHTHTSVKKGKDNLLAELCQIRNKLIGIPGTIRKVTGTYFEVYRLEVRGDYKFGITSRCDYATKASKIRIFNKRGDIIGFEITEKSETNLTMLTEVLSYQVLSEE
ncbi:MAG: hypothetical protein RBT65_12490 [Methanolobus sp.]|nr:hypothetical protein [Methanolobus sp.]